MSFEALGLDAALLRAIQESGYTQPTSVQQQAIPAAMAGRDLLVSSQTGSGKTAAFMLPALHRFASTMALGAAPTGKTPNQQRQAAKSRGERFRFTPAQPRMLVLAPTRELAQQVTQASEQYGRYMRKIRTVSILGGMPYPKQLQLLSRNPEILVATPGRLLDHLESGKIDFSALEMLVLDEADRMLDMGFIEDIENIVAHTPASRQTLLFSATLEGVVGSMAQRITRDPLTLQVTSVATRHENIQQRVHYVDDLTHKNRLLDHLLTDTSIDQAVIFTATKRDADQLADRLYLQGHAAAALHGDMPQGARNRTLNALRSKNLRVLVATDVAARGIDVPGITHVFNFDLPRFAEDYVHRIGRTGRAGRKGLAVSLVNPAEHLLVKRIERLTKQSLPVDVIEGFEPKRAAHLSRPAPRKGAGWKPGDGKKWSGSGKPSQRHFAGGEGAGKPGKPHYARDARPGEKAARPGEQRSARPYAPRPARRPE